MPPVVSLIGKSGSGKTTLLCLLIPALTSLGVRVGTIKHHAHASTMDQPGKDTWRHKQAGAAVVALASPFGVGVVRDTDHELSLEELVHLYFQEVDLVLTEGYKQGPAPKVEVFRSAAHAEPLAGRDRTWLALVSDVPLQCGLPLFDLEDAAGLAAFLISSLRLTVRACNRP